MEPKVANEETAEGNLDYRVIAGRKRRRKTEARILEAALHVFAEKGPDAPVIDDFIKAAGVARGTFYNYFNNTGELLVATSAWMADDLIESIEGELAKFKDPVLRHGIGVRMWMRKAATDPAWCKFVSVVWLKGGYVHDNPLRDIRLGMKAGEFSCHTAECGWDLTLGTVRQGMIRLLTDPKVSKQTFPDQISDLILQGLGLSKRRRKEILAYELPEMRRPAGTMM